jgi:hypothetical protein
MCGSLLSSDHDHWSGLFGGAMALSRSGSAALLQDEVCSLIDSFFNGLSFLFLMCAHFGAKNSFILDE